MQCRLIKDKILDQFLVDWFVKSLLLNITKDITMLGSLTKEKVILYSWKLDLILSYFGTLNDLIPCAPRISIDPPKPTPKPHDDGVIGLVSHAYVVQLMGQMSMYSNPLANVLASQNSIGHAQNFDVHLVKYTKLKNS
jgi:hypothetical protein